jgi:hypothetical protein
MLPERVRAIASVGDVGTRISARTHQTPTRTRAVTVSTDARSRRMGLGWDVSGLTGRTIQVLDTHLEET